jgi:hypothetical protein
MYVQYFETADEDCDAIFDFTNNSEICAWDGVTDLGVGEFLSRSTNELEALMCWPSSRPPLFANLRSKTGRSEWAEKQHFSADDVDLEPLSLLWHQMCGVAAIISKVWTEEPGAVPGVLLADAVGLGKTAQIIAVIAMIIQVWAAEVQQAEGKTAVRPPILGKRQIAVLSYFG